MSWLKTAGRAFFFRRKVEAELDDEMRFHLEKAQEELVARGIPPGEARLQALREFGGIEQHKEECRDERGISGLEALGRTFAAEEEREGHPVTILPHALWQKLFGGAATAIGASVTVDGTPCTVVGVLPAWFVAPDELSGSDPSEIFLPLGYSPADVAFRGSHFLRTVGRLRAGASVTEASAALDAVARSFVSAYPGFY